MGAAPIFKKKVGGKGPRAQGPGVRTGVNTSPSQARSPNEDPRVQSFAAPYYAPDYLAKHCLGGGWYKPLSDPPPPPPPIIITCGLVGPYFYPATPAF